jgi:hypothetical protein
LENARNVPFLNAVAALDELVPITGTRAQNTGAPELGLRGFDQLGYRYRFTVYPLDHFSFGFLSYDLPYAAEFLGDAAVERDPHHVTYSYAPASDDVGLGLVHDHAYWVSEVRLADPSNGVPIAKGTVDAFTHTAGKGDPSSTPGSTAGAAPVPYLETSRAWGPAPPIPVENKLTVKLSNVGRVVLDTGRAGLDLDRSITIALTTSSNGALVLEGDFRGKPVVTADDQQLAVTVERGRLVIPIESGTKTLVVTPPAPASAKSMSSTRGGGELPATGGSAEVTGVALLTSGLVAYRGTRRVGRGAT